MTNDCSKLSPGYPFEHNTHHLVQLSSELKEVQEWRLTKEQKALSCLTKALMISWAFPSLMVRLPYKWHRKKSLRCVTFTCCLPGANVCNSMHDYWQMHCFLQLTPGSKLLWPYRIGRGKWVMSNRKKHVQSNYKLNAVHPLGPFTMHEFVVMNV